MKLERFDYVTPESGTRTTRFDIVFPNGDGQYACNICTVFQFSSIKDFTLQAPSVGWSSWQSQTDLVVISLIAEAFRQAADLLTEWAADAGKPHKEVLR